MDSSERIENYLKQISDFVQIPEASLRSYYNELQNDNFFLESLNKKIINVAQFQGKQFSHVSELRLYRSLLYLLVRSVKPECIVETGVLHGFSSAFMLLAIKHNGNSGKLISVDYPGNSGNYNIPGNNPLPIGYNPGWIIPEDLRVFHQTNLGKSHEVLPLVFTKLSKNIDFFLHDSDHSYNNMIFEMSYSFNYLKKGGLIVADNIDYNNAYNNFKENMNLSGIEFYSFNTSNRIWKHGIIRKEV